jgi:hypothetical protein
MNVTQPKESCLPGARHSAQFGAEAFRPERLFAADMLFRFLMARDDDRGAVKDTAIGTSSPHQGAARP